MHLPKQMQMPFCCVCIMTIMFAYVESYINMCLALLKENSLQYPASEVF